MIDTIHVDFVDSDRGEGQVRAADLEKRVAALEGEVARLRHDLAASSAKQQPWWEEVAGVFADDPAFEEAMRLGREWRESFKPNTSRKKSRGGSRHRPSQSS